MLLVAVALVMAAMMAATAVPAFAVKGGNGGGAVLTEESFTCIVGDTRTPCEAKIVETPSGNFNATVHGPRPKEGPPEGGNGGGGAVLTEITEGTCIGADPATTYPCEAKIVETPSGNFSATLHGSPKE